MSNLVKAAEVFKRKPVIIAILAILVLLAVVLVLLLCSHRKAAGAPAASSKAPSGAAAASDVMTLCDKSFHDETLSGSSQIILVTAKELNTFIANLQTYQKKDGKWYRVMSVDSRIGSGGLMKDSERIEGNLTTPIGVYDLPYAFGVYKNPGTKLPYKNVGENTYYDGQYGSKTYNDLVEGQPDNNEYEYMYSPAYLYGIDIAFNTEQKTGKGNGIFLHCFTDSGKTAGCVSIDKNNLVKLLKWIDPAQKPKILICPESDLSKYFS